MLTHNPPHDPVLAVMFVEWEIPAEKSRAIFGKGIAAQKSLQSVESHDVDFSTVLLWMSRIPKPGIYNAIWRCLSVPRSPCFAHGTLLLFEHTWVFSFL